MFDIATVSFLNKILCLPDCTARVSEKCEPSIHLPDGICMFDNAALC